jgi:hypothetical protein
MSAAGAELFGRYAYPPNALGYCGPDDVDLPALGARAREFDGAWAYLEFLASVAGIADPLAYPVVEAYWIGNALLDSASPAALTAYLRSRFAGQHGGTWMSASERAVPHHSFHVFEVYPWAGLLRRTSHPAAVSVLDRCRIRTGVVVSVSASVASVSSRPLVWDGSSLRPGPPRVEEVSSLVSDALNAGDRVALHWDWICDVITAEQEDRLLAEESRRLGLV